MLTLLDEYSEDKLTIDVTVDSVILQIGQHKARKTAHKQKISCANQPALSRKVQKLLDMTILLNKIE